MIVDSLLFLFCFTVTLPYDWLKKLVLLSSPEIKPKPIRTSREARVLPRSGLLRVLTSSSDWFNLLFVFDVIGHNNCLFVLYKVTSISVIWYQVCYLLVQKWNAVLRIPFNRAITIHISGAPNG